MMVTVEISSKELAFGSGKMMVTVEVSSKELAFGSGKELSSEVLIRPFNPCW